MNIADIVISLNGRDVGKRFLVIEIEDNYSMLADGKCRRYEKPKRKKNKHIRFESKLTGQVAEKLIKGEKVTNNELRKTLAALMEGGL
ncbi:MAG: KOW domain-containing RNA-binding protein [Oscillospiraceae bacterium]|jgi:ribosomal protein L14E/L6E/L27E|nr:KOW domain-containing RNA-binding protein [Oscillospiraceae bacterium]